MHFYLMKIGMFLERCTKFGASSREYRPVSFYFRAIQWILFIVFQTAFRRSASEIKPCFIFATAYLPTVNRFKQVGAHHFAHLA